MEIIFLSISYSDPYLKQSQNAKILALLFIVLRIDEIGRCRPSVHVIDI
jgi:hypothetical protein